MRPVDSKEEKKSCRKEVTEGNGRPDLEEPKEEEHDVVQKFRVSAIPKMYEGVHIEALHTIHSPIFLLVGKQD